MNKKNNIRFVIVSDNITLIVLANNDFRDEEYLDTSQVLRRDWHCKKNFPHLIAQMRGSVLLVYFPAHLAGGLNVCNAYGFITILKKPAYSADFLSICLLLVFCLDRLVLFYSHFEVSDAVVEFFKTYGRIRF